MLDMFGFEEGKAANNKWNIKTFATGYGGVYGSKPLANASLANNDNLEFSKSMGNYSKVDNEIQAQLDKLYKEMTLKRKELGRDLAELKSTAKGEVIAMMHKTDIDIINSQLRIVESKLKAKNDRFKNERDEKKFYFVEKNKGTGVSDTPQIAITNSPMSVGSIPTAGGVNIVRAEPQTPTVKPAEPVQALKPTDLVVPDTMGINSLTKAEYDQKNNDILAQRLAQISSSNGPENYTTAQGVRYDVATKSLLRTPSDDVLFIDKSSGKYYFRSYVTDNTGTRTENQNFVPPGVLSIGKGIVVNNAERKVLLKYVDEKQQFNYRVVSDLDDMPDFYKAEWAHPKTERYVLSEELLQQL